ncbi:hypothetical protein P7C71_g2316, partial [Lecanoromycetidae sp. Uapishka_2]
MAPDPVPVPAVPLPVPAVPQQAARGFGTGWIHDDYDHNDKLLVDLYGMQRLEMKEVYQAIVEKAEQRTKVNLKGSCPPVYNQFGLGSCVANATAAALRFAWKNSIVHLSTPYDEFDPSRLWIYYYARLLDNERKDLEFRDTGCNIRDALKVLKKKGVCTEQAWKYLSKAEADAVDDLQAATKDADAMPPDCRAGIVPVTAKEKSATKFFEFGFDYHRIRSLSDVKDKAAAADTVIKQMCACLAEGFPIIFGFRMYYEADGKTEEFRDPKNWTGDVFNVDKLEKRGGEAGGHAVLCVGFDTNKKLFCIMNSWGNDWKDKGFFWMPFSWFERKGTTYDLWTIRPDLAPLLRDHDPIQ